MAGRRAGLLAIYAAQLFLRLVEHLEHPSEGVYQRSVHARRPYGVVPARLYSPVSGKNDSLIGETPDRARQICNECPDNNLLISADCYQLAGGDSRVNAEPFDSESDDVEVLLTLEPPEEHGELLDSQAARLIAAYPNR